MGSLRSNYVAVAAHADRIDRGRKARITLAGAIKARYRSLMPTIGKATKRRLIALLLPVLRRSRRQARQPRLRAKSYLDIGCGLRTHEAFVNLDYGWHRGLDVCWDITRGLPFPDNRFTGVFSEHCLEHLPIEATDRVLAEVSRVLRPGGTVRIVVPDGALYCARYMAKATMPDAEMDGYQGLYSPMMSVNRVFYAHGHRYIYDFDTMHLLLKRHGFVEITNARFGNGRDPALLIDWEARASGSLYVEASKPGR